jgi:hypothetical protein
MVAVADKRFRVLLVLTIAGAVALTPVGVQRLTAGAAPGAPLVYHLHEVETSVVPVDTPPTGDSAGDLRVFTATVTSDGKPFGRYIGHCAFVGKTDIYCGIDLNVPGQGRLELAGELSTKEADATLPVTGGSGRFVQAHGYLANHQVGLTADQELYLYLGSS